MALVITTTTLNLSATGASAAQLAAPILQASGAAGPVRWSLMSGSVMPGGLMLSQSGQILGVAGITGTFTIVVSATDLGTWNNAAGGQGMNVPGPTVGATITLVIS
jgi:uncharacterized protein GlcG (DUF336 family)